MALLQFAMEEMAGTGQMVDTAVLEGLAEVIVGNNKRKIFFRILFSSLVVFLFVWSVNAHAHGGHGGHGGDGPGGGGKGGVGGNGPEGNGSNGKNGNTR